MSDGRHVGLDLQEPGAVVTIPRSPPRLGHLPADLPTAQAHDHTPLDQTSGFDFTEAEPVPDLVFDQSLPVEFEH